MRRLRLSLPNQVLAVLCLMYLTLYIDRVNISTAGPIITQEFGLTNGQFGLVLSAFAYPYAFLQLLGGWLSDRLGSRVTLTLSGVIVCAATASTGLVGGLASLFAVRLALGLGEGAAFPTATRALAAWLPESRWGFAQGITHAASRFGNAVASPIVALLILTLSWRGSFVVLGLASLVWVALWLWRFRDDPRQHPGMTPAELAPLRPSAAGGRPAVPWFALQRRMLPVTAVDFCYGWTLWVFLTWIPSFFAKNFHLDLQHSAYFTTCVLLAGVLGDSVGGIASDWLYRRSGDIGTARRNVIVVGMIGGFLFLLPVVTVPDLTVVTICLSAACFFVELIVGPIWSVPMDIAPRYAGSASGMMNFGFGMAGIISPWAFGAIVDWTGSWTLPFIGSIMLLPIGAALAFLMRADRPFVEPAARMPAATVAKSI
ncbi:MAG TPA: MFS transporter [Aliidongia sp.]|nr:MFS transporter [Aliidongia sp.]